MISPITLSSLQSCRLLTGVVLSLSTGDVVPLAVGVDLHTVLVGPGGAERGRLVVLPRRELAGGPCDACGEVSRVCQNCPVREGVHVRRGAGQVAVSYTATRRND